MKENIRNILTQDWFLDIMLCQNGKTELAEQISNMIYSVPIAYDMDNNGWILCSNQMPEEDGVKVLLQDWEGEYFLGVSETNGTFKGFVEGKQWASEGCYKYWKPLIGPYEVEEKGKE